MIVLDPLQTVDFALMGAKGWLILWRFCCAVRGVFGGNVVVLETRPSLPRVVFWAVHCWKRFSLLFVLSFGTTSF